MFDDFDFEVQRHFFKGKTVQCHHLSAITEDYEADHFNKLKLHGLHAPELFHP